ncbi:putative TCP-1/cpn60 family chaperonin [Neospora caninum Liverpool]|uniref:T-complex protein 1 subunit alpha n=1 Tax=Neospora caninum (strain Liverpool) TaxID=572307 RepID=F0VHR8_NEOCL|nr:putative TCP-1/cpn60 family chaperonin [Neospora caninum Liverpool]CBZ53279.1 putative TCP-1/cpn60 family chaperonin [Neospora caninum Liverpool]CEL67265.1 TPA: TCP-1/cpn60 family chaperonin, putative [Neospora caninum Liverpool]|eukprot:XP_003883311.1 putative TCP-1/cpn60 family chaperonin [Neospora caninum Liverpool]
MALAIFGDRQSGQDVRTANAAAVQSIANILRSSLGPQGLDKMLVDDIGDMTITNDGATILKQLEVQHPAAKVLVELSDLQDKEVGDGTTSVVLLAAEFLRVGNQLVKEGVHPTAVIAGFKLAMKESVKYIQEHLTSRVDANNKEVLLNVATTTISSKLIGTETNHFADLVVRAILSVKMITERGDVKYPVSSINIIKTHGKSMRESTLVEGYALKAGRAAQGMPQCVKNARVALLDFNLRQHRMQLGVQIQVDNPEELEKIRQKEKDITAAKIQKILASGANVILTTQGIDDMAMKYFVEAGAIAVRRVDRKDLRRIAKITEGTVVLTMATLDGDEKFDASCLGSCEEVYEERIGDWDHLLFKGCKGGKAATVILRGANEYMLDEVDRSVHDALCAVSRALEHTHVCPGGGAVETSLSVYLENFARTLGSREQLAIAAFAESLLIIPKTLAVNAALDATELVARLRAVHAKAQGQLPDAAGNGDDELKWHGLDLVTGKTRNNMAAGVIEAAVSKTKALRFATEAAVTILRIDDLIKIAPEPERGQPDD